MPPSLSALRVKGVECFALNLLGEAFKFLKVGLEVVEALRVVRMCQ